MVPKTLTERQREIAAKCVLLGIDFEVEKDMLIVKTGPIAMAVLSNGKVAHVDILSGNMKALKGEGVRLTAKGLLELWHSLAIFSDAVVSDREAAEKILKFAAVNMLQEGQQVLQLNPTDVLDSLKSLTEGSTNLPRLGASFAKKIKYKGKKPHRNDPPVAKKVDTPAKQMTV